MTILKRVLSFILTFVFVLGVFATVPLSPIANAASVDDLTFELSDDGTMYQVSGCNQSASGELVIPSTYNGLPVTRIGANAFFSCESLTSLVIPEGVDSIGSSAFSHCTSLTNILIPNTVTCLGNDSFNGCSSLLSLDIPNSVIKIGERTFLNCKNLTSIKIGDSVTEIGRYAFSGCATIKKIELPKSVQIIDWGVFYGCKSLENFIIQNTVTSIGQDAFFGCISLLNITIPESVVSIDNEALGYKYDSWGEKRVKIDDFTIYGMKYSVAEEYATEYGFMFIESSPHIHNFSENIKVATCTQDGLKTFSCVCGETKTETIPALGHDFDEGIITKPQTCKVYGEKTYTCKRCGISNIETLPPLGHKIEKWVVVREPNYNLAGVKRGECVVCKEMFTETEFLKLDTPKVKPTITTNGIKLEWSKVEGAEYYVVVFYTYNIEKDIWVKNGETTTTTLNNYSKKLKNGIKYRFKVCAYAPSKDEIYGNFGTYCDDIELTFFSAPIVSTTSKKNGINLSWETNSFADSYIIYRRTYNASTKKYSGWTVLNKAYTGTSYTDTTVKLGTTYSYAVKAANKDATSSYKATTTLKYNVTPTVKVANVSNGVKVSWSTAANATGYTVYSSTYNAKTKKWSGWTNRGTTKANVTSWVDKKATKSGAYYKYTVRAMNGKVASSYNKSGASTLFLAQPTVKITNNASGIKASWNQIAGAKGYTIYRQEVVNGKWTGWKNMGTIKNAKTVSWVDKSAVSGTTYRYTVRAVNGKVASTYKATSGLLYLAQPTTTVKAVSNGINIAWTQCDGATGYTVYRMEYNAKTKKWSGWKNMGTEKAEKSNWTDKSAKKGVTYRYTVKAVNGKTASTYKASGSVKR